MILANNAIYCPGNTALNVSGLTGSGITVRSNVVEGNLSGATIDSTRFLSGGSAASTFRDVADMDLWPTPSSALIGQADASVTPTLDFNETPRTAPFDVGAYETNGLSSNPGWKVSAGFKAIGPRDATPPASPQNLQVR
jgi:hypothetical protein